MLFAEGEITQGMSIAACVVAVLSLVKSYFSERDKLRYDARMLKMEAAMEACGKQHAADAETIKELREKDAQQQREIDSLKRQLAESQRDRGKMHDDLTKLKNEMTARNLRADSTERPKL